MRACIPIARSPARVRILLHMSLGAPNILTTTVKLLARQSSFGAVLLWLCTPRPPGVSCGCVEIASTSHQCHQWLSHWWHRHWMQPHVAWLPLHQKSAAADRNRAPLAVRVSEASSMALLDGGSPLPQPEVPAVNEIHPGACRFLWGLTAARWLVPHLTNWTHLMAGAGPRSDA